MWHKREAPDPKTPVSVYAVSLDALYTTDRAEYNEWKKLFRDDVEYISGVVYRPNMPKPKEKEVAVDNGWKTQHRKK